MVNFRPGVGNGRSAHAGFVGENPTGAADPQCLIRRTDHAAGDGSGRKCSLYNGHKGAGHSLSVDDQRSQTQQDISRRPKGYQRFRRFSDLPGTAQKQATQNTGKTNPQYDIQAMRNGAAETFEHPPNSGNCRIDLGGVPHTKGRSQSEQAVGHRHGLPRFSQALLHHVHRAAYPAFRALCPKPNCQRGFRKFGDHAQNTAQPHPEDRSRPSKADRPGYAHQISRPHGSRQGGTQGLKSGIFFPRPQLGKEVFQCFRKESQLYKPKANTEEQSHRQNQHQRGCAPEEGIEGYNKFRKDAS